MVSKTIEVLLGKRQSIRENHYEDFHVAWERENILKKVAEALPTPEEMKSCYVEIVPAKTVFYSIRTDEICEYKKKPIYHNPSTIAHRMFFFCTDIKLCMEAADDDPKLPVWVATNQNKLNIIRINGWRHDFLKPYYKKRVSYYDEETILNYYLIKHNLDGFQAAVDYDQDDSGERKYEFAFLEDVVEQKMNINNCIPLLKF